MTMSIDIESKCNICGQELSQEASSFLFDCGGTCLTCMAQIGDPECHARYVKLEDERTTWIDILGNSARQ